MKAAKVSFVVTLGLVGCQPVISPAGGTVPAGGYQIEPVAFSELESGAMSNVTAAASKVITNQADWEAEVQRVKGAGASIPAVDFTKEIVLAAYLGEKPSGGHSINLKKVEWSSAEMSVILSKQEPKPGEAATTALTTPYVWAKATKMDLPVNFRFD